jgi:hypothetical protein
METVVGVAGILVGIALYWTGRKRLELSRFSSALISTLDVAVLIVSVILLGWLGLVVVLVANALALVIWSVYLAAKQEELLLYAATQCDSTKEEIYALEKRLRKMRGPFRQMGPIDRATLIRALAERARSPAEIEQIAHPLALLWAVHRPDLVWLAGKFDQLLRLYGLDASESMRVADTIAAATKTSAATFEEMVDALVAAG